jgi:AcrR family transcriptional regulator
MLLVMASTTQPGRRARTRAVDVEAVLLEAAHRLLESEGVDALTVRRVATEAGVAPMGIYHRFGGKEGLAEALFVDGNRLLTEALQQGEAGDALDELREGCRQYRRFALANPALYSLMFERAVPGFEPSPEVLETCMKSFGVLVDCTRRAQAAGVLRAGDAFAYAHRIWSACHGAVSLELRQIGFMEDLDAEYEGLISTLVEGLADTTSGPS